MAKNTKKFRQLGMEYEGSVNGYIARGSSKAISSSVSTIWAANNTWPH